ncbi:MAG: hypothetical protein KC731_06620 [Myxococcales bacterium]|nr:hypothetical protein [Myxococcales bacterium]
MAYRSRLDAYQLRVDACRERLMDVEASARAELGGALPFDLEARIARLESRLSAFDEQRLGPGDLPTVLAELDTVLDALARAVAGGLAPTVDDAFVDFVRGAFQSRARRRAAGRFRQVAGVLRRLDPDAVITRGSGDIEARLLAHGCRLFFVGRVGVELDALIACPLPRGSGHFTLRPHRWWRRVAGHSAFALGPVALGHETLDDRFVLEGEPPEEAFGAELLEALVELCHYDEPTLAVHGAAAWLRFHYDVAFEPLAAAVRVVTALSHHFRPPPPPPPPREAPRPRALLIPVVPARLGRHR